MKKDFRINNFDLLRLLAATQVLLAHSLFHLNVHAGTNVLNWFPGVPIFFVISGYLISKSFEKKNSFKNYCLNRFLRIYPALWGCLFITILTASYFGGVNFFNTQALIWLPTQMSGIIYTPVIFKNYGFGSYNGSLWTIPIELQFYICIPIMYFIARHLKATRYFFVVLWFIFILLAVLIRIHYQNFGSEHETRIEKLLRYSFIPHIWMFLSGVIFQQFNVYKHRFIYGKGLFWLAGYLLASLLIPFGGVAIMIQMFLLGVVVLSLAYTVPTLSKSLLRGNDISYGVYIYHGIVLNVFVQLAYVGTARYIAFLFVLTFVFATLSWIFIEKPFLKKKVKTIHRIDDQTLQPKPFPSYSIQ